MSFINAKGIKAFVKEIETELKAGSTFTTTNPRVVGLHLAQRAGSKVVITSNDAVVTKVRLAGVVKAVERMLDNGKSVGQVSVLAMGAQSFDIATFSLPVLKAPVKMSATPVKEVTPVTEVVKVVEPVAEVIEEPVKEVEPVAEVIEEPVAEEAPKPKKKKKKKSS